MVLLEQRAAKERIWWVGDFQGELYSLVKVLFCAPGMCVHWPTGPSTLGGPSQVPAWGLLAPSPALAILGTSCVQAWGGMGNSAQTRDAGSTAWTAIPASWVFDRCRLCPCLQPQRVMVSGFQGDTGPTGKGKEGHQTKLPSGHSLLSVSGIVVSLLSNGFVFTSWDMESRDRSGFLLPIGYQKAQSQMSCCFPRTSESGTCLLVDSPHSRLCLAALPQFFLRMFS